MEITVTVTDNKTSSKAVNDPKRWVTAGNSLATGDKVYKDYFLEQLREGHITIAKDALQEELAKGFDKNYTRIVDRVIERKEEDVKHGGKIEYQSKADVTIKQAILDSYLAITSRSKFVTGEYRKSNVVFHNGKMVAEDLPSLEKWLDGSGFLIVKSGDLIRFANLAPYARRLELLGQTSKGENKRTGKAKKIRKKTKDHDILNVIDKLKSKVIPKPNGTYYVSARAIKRLMAGSARVKFEFIPGNIMGLGTKPYRSRRPGGGKPFRGNYVDDHRPYLYPTIAVAIIGDDRS